MRLERSRFVEFYFTHEKPIGYKVETIKTLCGSRIGVRTKVLGGGFRFSGRHAQGLRPALFPIGFPQPVLSHDAQVQHGLSHIFPPPGSWTLEARLYEIAVGALDRPRTDGQVQGEGSRVVQLLQAIGKVAPCRAHGGVLFVYGFGFDVQFQLCNQIGSLSRQQSLLPGLQPIPGGIRRANLAGRGQIVTNVEQIHPEPALRTKLHLDLVRYPLRAVAYTVQVRPGVESQRQGQLLHEESSLGRTAHRDPHFRNGLALPLNETDLRFSPVEDFPLAGVRRIRLRLDDRNHSAIRFGYQSVGGVRVALCRQAICLGQIASHTFGDRAGGTDSHGNPIVLLEFGRDLAKGDVHAKISDGPLQRQRMASATDACGF